MRGNKEYAGFMRGKNLDKPTMSAACVHFKVLGKIYKAAKSLIPITSLYDRCSWKYAMRKTINSPIPLNNRLDA